MKTIRKAMAAGAIAAALSAPACADYSGDVAEKFGRGLSNGALGWVEFGKNVYNESVQHGPVYIPLGLLKGVAHAVGRTALGAADMASFLIPSPAFIQPGKVWEHMDTETSYGVK